MMQGALHCFHRTYLFMPVQNFLTFWIRQNSSLVKLIHQISLQIIYSTLLLLYQCHLKHNSFNNEEKDPTKVTVDQLLWNHCYLWGVNVWDNQYFGSLVCCIYNVWQFITLIYICGDVNFGGKNNHKIHEHWSSKNNDDSTVFHLWLLY